MFLCLLSYADKTHKTHKTNNKGYNDFPCRNRLILT